MNPNDVPKHLQPGVHVCYEEAIISIPDGKLKFTGIPKPKSFSGLQFSTFIREYFTEISLVATLGYIGYLKFSK